MAVFGVAVEEVRSRVVAIGAGSAGEALASVRDMHARGELALGPADADGEADIEARSALHGALALSGCPWPWTPSSDGTAVLVLADGALEALLSPAGGAVRCEVARGGREIAQMEFASPEAAYGWLSGVERSFSEG